MANEPSDRYEEIDAGDTLWRFDRTFLESNWSCIWGNGCQGIADVAAPELGLGCCSMGAHLDGEEEARNVAALAAFAGIHPQGQVDGLGDPADVVGIDQQRAAQLVRGKYHGGCVRACRYRPTSRSMRRCAAGSEAPQNASAIRLPTTLSHLLVACPASSGTMSTLTWPRVIWM